MKLSLSMPLTFNSKQIDKVVTIDDVGSLSNPEVLLLKDELMTAINNMDNYIKKFKQEKQAVNMRGTGCMIATALACNLAKNNTVESSCKEAIEYVQKQLLNRN